jgi:hypothetical protein
MNRLMHLPGHARIWIFQADRELQPEEEKALSEELLAFQQGWKTHGSPLTAGVAILFSTFAIVAVDEKMQAPSGCSIDKAFRLLQEFGERHAINFFDRLRIAWQQGEPVVSADKDEVKAMLASGELAADTLYFDNRIQLLSQLESEWLQPMHSGWFSGGITA